MQVNASFLTFAHPTQVSSQVYLAATCDYLRVCLTRALLSIFYNVICINRPTLPVSKQASGNLLKKAVAAAHHSVNKTGTCITSSLKYDPTSPPSPIRSHSYEEKQQQKELLLQQHRELQKCFLQMKHHEEIRQIDMAVDGGLEMEEVLGVQENTKEEIDENESRDDDQECQEEENIQEPEVSFLNSHHHCRSRRRHHRHHHHRHHYHRHHH